MKVRDQKYVYLKNLEEFNIFYQKEEKQNLKKIHLYIKKKKKSCSTTRWNRWNNKIKVAGLHEAVR